MNMIVRIWNRLDPAPLPVAYTTEETRSEAREALVSAEVQLQAVTARAPLVERLAASLREQNERNHFAEMLEATMRGTG